jgi:hypothetical protein
MKTSGVCVISYEELLRVFEADLQIDKVFGASLSLRADLHRTEPKACSPGDRHYIRLSPQRQADIYVGMATLAEFNLDETIAVLTRTPATLDAMLRGLPKSWVRSNEGKDTWSAFDIVGHLIVGERTDWMPRTRRILENGEARPFDPFDRFAQSRESQSKSLEQLLDDFARLRRENLAALLALNLQPEDLNRRGRHPALGVVTLSQLLATWAVHDLTHVHQLSRVMAHQYRDAVGPWSAYLGVLQCSGHSS